MSCTRNFDSVNMSNSRLSDVFYFTFSFSFIGYGYFEYKNPRELSAF
ncbi:MAG: hypothetical protein Q4G53_01125 [Clostridia bacterium]|nr:hypothetical protein [Clostridia bacterium]